MWNFFSRDTFSFDILEKEEGFQGFSVFSLHRGVRKSNGEQISIFTYNKKQGNSFMLDIARTTVKKLKTLKHPNLLTYLDSYEDEQNIHLVTNFVVSLFSYLKKWKSDEIGRLYLSWGLSSIGEVVAFLNDADLRHNNIFHGSVFVDEGGSWKLGEVGYLTKLKEPFPKKCLECLNKYNPPETKTDVTTSTKLDVWGLGVLLWEVFNGEMSRTEVFGNPSSSKVPKNLLSLLVQMTQKNVSKRSNVSEYIETLSKNNLLCETLDVLNNFHLKEKHFKMKACKNIITLLPNIPKDVCIRKVLFLIKQAHDFEAENGSLFVPVVSKIAAISSEDDFHKIIEPFVINLFLSNDRVTRLTLLLEIKDLISKMSSKSINDIFPSVLNGFLDTNNRIRGETVKAMVYFAPRLSSKNLNEEALRNLVHLQTKDPEIFIRTNATICLGKITMYIQPSNRRKILLSAFLHSLRDPSNHVRNAGAQAFSVIHVFFTIEEIGRNILPGLVSLSVDPCSNVREDAFKTIKILLGKLENVSINPEQKEELEKYVQSQSCEQSTSNSWASWTFTAITSKFLKSSGENQKNNKNSDLSEAITGDMNTSKNEEHEEVIVDDIDDNEKEEEEEEEKYTKSGKIEREEEIVPDDEVEEYQKLEGWDVEDWIDFNEDIKVQNETPKYKDETHMNNKKDARHQQIQKKKSQAGPMKLGTRVNKMKI